MDGIDIEQVAFEGLMKKRDEHDAEIRTVALAEGRRLGLREAAQAITARLVKYGPVSYDRYRECGNDTLEGGLDEARDIIRDLAAAEPVDAPPADYLAETPMKAYARYLQQSPYASPYATALLNQASMPNTAPTVDESEVSRDAIRHKED